MQFLRQQQRLVFACHQVYQHGIRAEEGASYYAQSPIVWSLPMMIELSGRLFPLSWAGVFALLDTIHRLCNSVTS